MTLDPSIFNILDIYNGPWTTIRPDGTSSADTLTGTAGNDDMHGAAGNDTVSGGAGNDRLFGGAGTDTLNGGAGQDQLYGLAGVDTINGGDGNDYIEGGDGVDILNGGAGTGDTFGYTDRGGTEGGVVVTLQANGGATVVSAYNHGLVIDKVMAGFENVVGSNFGDTIVGNDGDNKLFGLNGQDEIRGGAGNDRIDGGAGNDWLVGGAGEDKIDGGAGVDTVDYSNSPGFVEIRADGTRGQGPGDSFGDTIAGFEIIIGSKYSDFIYGDAMTTRLEGGDGYDTLALINGAGGTHTFIGGGGDNMVSTLKSTDTFVFQKFTDFANGDMIKFFDSKDTVDLSAIDADPSTAVNDAFHFGTGVGGIIETMQGSLQVFTFEGHPGQIYAAFSTIPHENFIL